MRARSRTKPQLRQLDVPSANFAPIERLFHLFAAHCVVLRAPTINTSHVDARWVSAKHATHGNAQDREYVMRPGALYICPV